jgi:hypothetical protein
VLQAIVSGRPLADVLTMIAELVQAEIPTGRAAVVVRDPNSLEIGVVAAPHLPVPLWPAVERQAIRTVISNPSAATAAPPRRIVVSADIRDDPS